MIQGRRITLAVLVSVISTPAFSVTIDDLEGPLPVMGSMAEVSDEVTDLGAGSWQYEYTVKNGNECIYRDPDEGVCWGDGDAWLDSWALPYFEDANITNIQTPEKWAYSIETVGVANEANHWSGVAAWQDPSDPNYMGEDSPFSDVEQVLYWYADEPFKAGWMQTGIQPEDSLGGFGFEAGYGETKSPHQTTFYFTGTAAPRQTISGDPSYPNSPTVSGNAVDVPEPGTLGLLTLALAGLWSARGRHSQTA